MNRTLWTVLADRQPVAVVAADARDAAWRIASALADHCDLPGRREQHSVEPCTPSQQDETLSRARQLGCDRSFLACVRGGMFLTHIDGLVLG